MATINVPEKYPTISAAIAATGPGDTIVVADGIYTQHVTINVPNLTLLCAQANVDARTRPFIPANESTITFRTPAFGTTNITITNNVTFNATGITPNRPSNIAEAIFIGDGCINTSISNNLIYTATANGIHISTSVINITNNCIVNNTLAGI